MLCVMRAAAVWMESLTLLPDPGPDQGQGDAQSERSLGRHLRSRRTEGHADSRLPP